MTPIDPTTAMLLDLLIETEAKEPPEPSDGEPYEMACLTSRRRDEWERERAGLYALLGARLTRAALDERRAAR